MSSIDTLEKRDLLLKRFYILGLDEGGGMNYLSDQELEDRITMKECELETKQKGEKL